MQVLVIGSGGREHALVWKIAQSPLVSKLYCAPGNAGSHQLAEYIPIAENDIFGLRDFAWQHRIDLTIVGPETPLALGIADAFAERDLCLFGPTKAAAQLEASKAFAKTFMHDNGIPTAPAEICESLSAAQKYIRQHQGPLVVKADGLAAGKGVMVCQTQDEALQAVHRLMHDGVFGKAGARVLLEEFLDGEEASFHVLVDGERIVPLASSQDHKRLCDHDQGPNTGGMGAYAPAPVITDALHARIMAEIIEPTVRGMAARGIPYRGVLYTGLMIVAGDPYVVEFNARFGDPEAQPLLVQLYTDLLPLLASTARGYLDSVAVESFTGVAVCVVMASAGYPGAYTQGLPITGLEDVAQLADTWVFHAGTTLQEGRVVTQGGRVLGVTARAQSTAAAIERAYHAVRYIHWPGVRYRQDIGQRALEHISP
jgi:phosphoribosylamine--glycine ligase